jgi:outer membrane immunogenic protein
MSSSRQQSGVTALKPVGALEGKQSMNKLTVLAAAAVFIGGANIASAADLGEGSFKDAPLAPLAPVWTGLYVGGHIGGLWSSDADLSAEKKFCKWYWGCSKWEEAKHVKFEEEDDDAAFIGGVHIGYNWQRDSSVFGIEADVDFADEFEYLATLRARLGYAAGNYLLYATAGVAFAGMDNNSVDFKTYKSYSYDDEHDDRVGFVVGGGLEYKIRQNWSVGMEGLYYGFGDDNNEYKFSEYGGCKGCSKKYKVSEEDDNDFWVVRARLSYHLQSEAEMEPPLK